MVMRRGVRRERPFVLSAKAIREVEFRERVRGYDPAQVDPLLDEVADRVAAMLATLGRLDAHDGDPLPVTDLDEEEQHRAVAMVAALLHVRAAHAEAARLVATARRLAREIEREARADRRRARRPGRSDADSGPTGGARYG